MKEGISIQELAQEIKRRSETKVDYLRPTRSLRFEVSPVFAELQEVAAGPRLVEVDGGMHMANADWFNQRSGNGNGHLVNGVEVVAPQTIMSLTIPGTNGLNHALPVNELAHTQIANHLGIPTKYYGRLQDEFPRLLAENVNTLLQASPPDEVRMVRSLDGKARAFLSNRYETLDNWDLMRFLMPLFAKRAVPQGDGSIVYEAQDTTLNGGGTIKALRGPDGNALNVDFRSCNITDSKLYIKLVVPNMTVELKVGTTLRAGCIIQNSEVGLGSISVLPFYEVLECTNGAFVTEWGNSRRHVGNRKGANMGADGDDGNDAYKFYTDATKRQRDKTFFLEMADVVRGTLNEVTFSRMLEPMRAAMGLKLTGNPDAVVDMVGRQMDLGEGEQDAILNQLLDTGDMTMWGLSNAITRYAQDVSSYDRATELEGIGGRVITLPLAEWRTIAEATRSSRKKAGASA